MTNAVWNMIVNVCCMCPAYFIIYYWQIYSNGWGPSDEGYSLDGPGALVQKTFENAAIMVSRQRDNLVRIFMLSLTG